MQNQYNAVVKQLEDRLFVAHCPSLPACVGQGATPADAIAKLNDVIATFLQSRPQELLMKCYVPDCDVAPAFHFSGIESRRVVTEKYLCDAHAHNFFTDYRTSEFVAIGFPHDIPGAVCVDLEMIVYHLGDEDDPVCLYAHEVGGRRRLCFMTNAWSWWALMAQIKQQPSLRRHTHAAWASTITELGGQLHDVLLDRREGEDWWSAELRIAKDGSDIRIHARASDAYVLAVIHDVPIFVVESALERFADRGESQRREGAG